jgi:glycosyltransferase involved in cell wall biosynthesis
MSRVMVDIPTHRIAVVVPCFRVREHILEVIAGIGPEVERVYVVDDACPEGTGDLVEASCTDSRVTVLRHASNLGVGGATMTGYVRAAEDGADVIVKLDGDGQMDASLIPDLVGPVVRGEADYAKGNRFFRLEGLKGMPTIRLFGNSLLSFMSKLSTGYWNIFDPTNGFTALHAEMVRELPLDKLSQRFFFESDLLFRLNTLGAVVVDVPMEARYLGEESNLRVHRVGLEFATKHGINLVKRLFYNYFLRNFNIASVELMLGLLLVFAGTGIGLYHWIGGAEAGRFASSGTVMLAALPVIIGTQMLLAFLGYDMQSMPQTAIHRRLARPRTVPRD